MTQNLLRTLGLLYFLLASIGALALPTDPDTGFDGDGERENPFPTQLNVNANRVFRVAAWDAYNRILIGGDDAGDTTVPVALIGRMMPTGNPDPTYGVSGLASISRASVNGMTVNDLLALPDGSALVCGDAEFSDRTMGYVARIDASGQQDTSWAPGSQEGILIVGGNDEVIGSRCLVVEQLGDGRIVVGGSLTRPDELGGGRTTRGLVELRTADGYPDESVGDFGMIEFDLTQYASRSAVLAIAEQPGEGILVTTGEIGWMGGRDLNTLRLGYDGRIDTSFTGFANSQAAPFGGFSGPVASEMMWPLPNGRIRQAMPRYSQGTGYLGELYWLDAQRDGDVLPYPVVKTLAHPLADSSLDFGGAALAPDGKVIYATRPIASPRNCTHNDASLGLARLLANGQPDTSFSTSGQFDWQPAADFANQCHQGVVTANDVALSRQGRIFSLHTISQGWPNATDTATSNYRPLLSMRVGEAFGAEPWDTLPDPVSFTTASGRPNSIRESEWVQVSGLDTGTYVPALVLGGELRIGFGEWSTARWVKNNDWVQVRGIAPASSGDSQTVRLLVGGIRAHNSWDSLGQRVQADFVITASEPALPGSLCSDGGLNINCSAAIPDQGTVSSSINFINGGNCNFVQSVRVGVDLEHGYVGDLRLTLTDPNGQVFIGGSVGIVSLLNRPAANANASSGSCGLADIIAVFDDDASLAAQTSCGMPVADPALSGERLPANPLSELVGRRTTGNDGAATSGLWTLTIADLAAGSSGQLHDWSLDLDCSASAPAISDLSVQVSGHSSNALVSGTGEAVPGDGVEITWTVTNSGPMATGNGRFRASLPDGLTDAIENAAWGCSTSAGGSCTPAIPCFGACLGNDIDAGLSLPVGGTATFFAIGTLTELAGDGMLVINGSSSVPLAIGGTRDDTPDNDHAQLQMPIQRITDIAVTGARHSWQGNVATIELDIANLGPSDSQGFSASIALPAGMSVTGFACRRGTLPCDDRHSIPPGPPQVNITHGNGMLPNRTSYTAIITATWPGSGAPGTLNASLSPDANAIDPDTAGFHYAIGAPSTTGGDIFSDDFE